MGFFSPSSALLKISSEDDLDIFEPDLDLEDGLTASVDPDTILSDSMYDVSVSRWWGNYTRARFLVGHSAFARTLTLEENFLPFVDNPGFFSISGDFCLLEDQEDWDSLPFPAKAPLLLSLAFYPTRVPSWGQPYINLAYSSYILGGDTVAKEDQMVRDWGESSLSILEADVARTQSWDMPILLRICRINRKVRRYLNRKYSFYKIISVAPFIHSHKMSLRWLWKLVFYFYYGLSFRVRIQAAFLWVTCGGYLNSGYNPGMDLLAYHHKLQRNLLRDMLIADRSVISRMG